MGPACPSCGTPLTWYGQMWGCDRERITFAPHQIQQQQPQPPVGGFRPPQGPQMGQPPMGPQMGQSPMGPRMGQSPMGPSMGHSPMGPNIGQAPVGPSMGMGGGGSLPVIPKTIPINTFQEQQLAQYPHATHLPGSHAIGARPTVAPAKARSNKTLILAAGGGVVVIAGVLIAVVATRGGGGAGGTLGASTRDGLVKATFESYARRDLDGLMKRSGFPGLKKYVTCDKDEAVSPEKEAEQLEEMKQEMERGIARLNGAVIKVGKIEEPDKPKILAKGEELGRGCTLKAPMEMHEVKVSISIIHDQGTSETHVVDMSLGKLDGQWFYSGVPKLGGCTAAVARIALLGSEEVRSNDMVNTLQPKLMVQCLGEEWGATIEKCVESALTTQEVAKCLQTLPEAKLKKLDEQMHRLLAKATQTEQRLLAMFPEPVVEKPPEDVAVAKPASDINVDDTYVPDVAAPDPNASDRGRPEQGDYGDFWLWTRGDNKVRVTSPLVEAVFPGKPEQKLVKAGTKTADGKDFWLYQFIHDLGDDGMLRLEIASLGRNAKSADDDNDPTVKSFAKIGQVKRRKRVIDGVQYVDLEAVEASTGGTLRALIIRDLPRGVLLIGVAATSPKTRAIGTQYLASIKALGPKDPTDDPELLTGVKAKKVGKKFLVQTENEDFSMELPLQPKITRAGPTDKSHKVTATAIAEKKGMQVSFDLSEFASWDALTYTPDKQFSLANEMKASMEKEIGIGFEVKDAIVAGAPGFMIESDPNSKQRVQVRMGWNRFQHRMLIVFCLEAKCDTWTESVKWGAPSAE